MECSIHHEFPLSPELLDTPLQSFLLWSIDNCSIGCPEVRLFCIIWNWYEYLFIFNITSTSTLFAVLLALKLLLALMRNSILVADFLSMMTSTENRGLTLTSSL